MYTENSTNATLNATNTTLNASKKNYYQAGLKSNISSKRKEKKLALPVKFWNETSDHSVYYHLFYCSNMSTYAKYGWMDIQNQSIK